MMIVLLSLHASPAAASTSADSDALPALSGSATSTQLSSPSPLKTASLLKPATTTDAPSTSTGIPGSTESASSAKPSDKTDDEATHVVRFDPTDGGTPGQASVKTGTLAAPPKQNPQRDGFRFEGWTLDGQPFDFQTPILQDTTLTAKWSKSADWRLSPDHGPAIGARLTISPPSRQEPYYIAIHAADNQTVGLTGDGRIYAWTQDSTPVQVPFPAQAPDGFHYLQATAGDQWQAALGSDQHVYTWTSEQATPMILDTCQNSKFTSISMNGDLLLTIDLQGQVHAIQNSQDDSRDPTRLPGQAQAVTAVSSASRILALDADGQAWAWDTTNTGSAKPERIRQDSVMRTVQALGEGVLLLDAGGQTRYLADSTSSTTVINLADGVQASRITANNSQAIITDKNGHVWTWKPGKTPIRADNRGQVYVQATAAGSGITAIDRQGSIFRWNLDAQGKPGKPAQPNTIQAPILETASLDGQTLKLTRDKDSWQTDVPAHTPESTIITITGKQGNQPFTRSLGYTVDQTLTREVQQGTAYTVRFNTGGGGPTPQDQNIQPVYGRVQRPSPDPTREGYQFDGWFTGEVAYDFSKPITQNLILTAKWTSKNPNTSWRINPDKGSQLGKESTTITPPATRSGIRFNQVSGGGYVYGDLTGYSLAVGSDGNAYAWGQNWYGQLGNSTSVQQNTPVPVPKPAGTPMDFTYVQAYAGGYHSLAIGSDGYVYTWGYNTHGQIGKNTTDNSFHLTPSRVFASNKSTAAAGPWLKAVQVSAGGWFALAIGEDGNTWAWGYNQYGSLGNGNSSTNTDTNYVPQKVRYPANAGAVTAVQVSAGIYHSLAVDTYGNTWAWGWNSYGKLGDNTTSDRHSPVKVFASAQSTSPAGPWLNAQQISTGWQHSLAIGTDGVAYAWGQNWYGQLGNPNAGRLSLVPSPVSFNLQLVITSVTFDTSPGTNLIRGDGSSVSVTTPAHLPGTVTVSVKYTTGGAGNTLTDTSLRYTYMPAAPVGVLPQAGGAGILLTLVTGVVSMGSALASRHHRRKQHQLSQT